MIAVTYGYARVSKADDESKNMATQLLLLVEHGIREDLVNSDVASGRNLQRPGWQELMTKVQEGDTIVVAFLDRLSRSFEDGVRTQAELTRRNIGIVAIRGNIDTREGSAAAKYSYGRCWPRGPARWIQQPSGSGWGWTGPSPAGSGWADLRRSATNRSSSPDLCAEPAESYSGRTSADRRPSSTSTKRPLMRT